jgi:RNA polymerase sigma-70 factor (ECF subfamily)
MTGIDEDDWTVQYKAFEKPLYNTVFRWLWNAADSEDVVQEAFLRCWRARDRVRADGFKALIFKTALRLASNHRRRKKLWTMVGFSESIEAELSVDAAEPVSRPVRDAYDALAEPLKRVLVLSEIVGMSYDEIAQVLGVKAGTVGSRRHRALEKLRSELESRGVSWNGD